MSAEASHPDTPPARLLELVELHPYEVLHNPAMPLLALEDPATWRRLCNRGLTVARARCVLGQMAYSRLLKCMLLVNHVG